MGQCISRGQPGPYGFARHYDAESVGSSVYNGGFRHTWGGHSESKGAKKRDKSSGGSNGSRKQTRGVATSFGFRRRPASTSRADNRRYDTEDKNGNGDPSEDYRVEDVLSGRSTPLARPRKEAVGQPLRTNRFGFRQNGGNKTAKVGDVGLTAEHAFSATGKDKDSAVNNNDKRSTNVMYNNQMHPPLSTQTTTTVIGAGGVPKTVTKQTIILTYQAQQIASHDGRGKFTGSRGDRSSSVPRTSTHNEPQKNATRFTLQTNQLPRLQYPSVKMIDTKMAKQVANSTRKVAAANDCWREGSGVSADSGAWTGGESSGGEGSPRSRRRPRNLEMVMRGAHSFHLRELQVADLDIMDDAVVTEHAVIPLPKLPSLFDEETSPQYENDPPPTFRPPTPATPKDLTPMVTETSNSPMSTLDRYRTRSRPTRIQTNVINYKDEEKFVLDRAQPERLNKQNSFIKSSNRVMSPPTVCSSKESSPSCKSEESHFGNSATDTWQTNAAGEAMATRSQDDVSIALSVSSCEDEKSKMESKEIQNFEIKEMPKKTIVIMDEPVAPHPLLMKSLTLSQHEALRNTMMGSMSSSNYSTTSTCTNLSGDPLNLTLTLEENKFDMSALETSTQSLLDDETSPADSLISSSSTSDSNNDLRIERDAPSISSSAYQTANTKTRSPEPFPDEEDGVDGEIQPPIDENIRNSEGSGEESKNESPVTPGTPTHASGSLSLSDGRDFFDDEIADQPALLFRKDSEGNPSSKFGECDIVNKFRRSKDKITASPLTQRNRKVSAGRIGGGTNRTPSLDTLSSLASDDLMMDNDLAQSVTSLQSVDDYIERLDSSLRSGINSLDEHQLQQELSSSKSAVRQWSQLLEQSNILDRQLAAISQGKSAPDSLSASNTSLANIGASLPVRTARLLQRSRAQTPSDGISDNGSPAPASLLQDVVDIKTLLIQLKRVLQEPGEEHHSTSSETLDPLLAVCVESPARGNGRRLPPTSPLNPDACADLRRQIIFLQSQLEERDRLVKVLQQQMHKMSGTNGEARMDDTCNVATQTDRLRPPMNTALTNSENSGLVSWNEQYNGRKLPTYSEAQKNRKPVVNGTAVKCTCGARKLNGLINGANLDNGQRDASTESINLKTNSRVGSRYLQALANGADRQRTKRDTSVGDRTLRKPTIQPSRSRSIENFQNHVYSTHNEPSFMKNVVVEESPQRHHTSYGDLYNGRVSSGESVCGNRQSPTLLNGQSTDTDYSSDGGYKSLPSTISCSGSPKKVSGIPRRSIENKFFPTKHNVKASAV